MTPAEKFDRAWALKEEIEFAKSQLQPSGSGHIHTTISYMTSRLEDLKKDISNELEK